MPFLPEDHSLCQEESVESSCLTNQVEPVKLVTICGVRACSRDRRYWPQYPRQPTMPVYCRRGRRRSQTKSRSLPGTAFSYNLAATYSHMAFRHTTIGATMFHFRVRDGTGWFHCAVTTRDQASSELKPALCWHSPIGLTLPIGPISWSLTTAY